MSLFTAGTGVPPIAVERVCRWLLEAVGEVRGSWLTGDDGGKRTRGKCRVAHFC